MPITLNPSDKGSSVTLSNNNLTAQIRSRQTGVVRSTLSKSTGKWYWEVFINDRTAGYISVGIATSAHPLTEGAIGGNGYYGDFRAIGASVCYNKILGGDNPEEGTSIYTTVAGEGNVVGVALDLDNSTLKFYRNGVYLSECDIGIANIINPVFPALGVNLGASNTTATINYGDQEFYYSIPEGYVAYCELPHFKSIWSQLDNIKASSVRVWATNVEPNGAAIEHFGHCWSTSPNPTIADSKTDNGEKTDNSFWGETITNLEWETTYYIRPYITTAYGTVYGTENSFITLAGVIKCLIQSGDNIYNITNGELTLVGIKPVTDDMFIDHGHDNTELINSTILTGIDKFKILLFEIV